MFSEWQSTSQSETGQSLVFHSLPLRRQKMKVVEILPRLIVEIVDNFKRTLKVQRELNSRVSMTLDTGSKKYRP